MFYDSYVFLYNFLIYLYTYYIHLFFIPDDCSKYDKLTSLEVRKEIFESVQKELRDEINIAKVDQVSSVTESDFYHLYFQCCKKSY